MCSSEVVFAHGFGFFFFKLALSLENNCKELSHRDLFRYCCVDSNINFQDKLREKRAAGGDLTQ